MQAEDDAQETENSAGNCPGLGVDWIVQVVPFQRSASVPWSDNPTAVQAVDEVHETPERKLNCAPDGFAVAWTVQAVPFQRSASVTPAPELSV